MGKGESPNSSVAEANLQSPSWRHPAGPYNSFITAAQKAGILMLRANLPWTRAAFQGVFLFTNTTSGVRII